MNRETSSSAERHQQISLLLPWYLNQTLETVERRRVEDHIRGCIICRRELVRLGKLAEAVKQASDLEIAAEASFNALRAKLQAPKPSAPSFEPCPGDRFERPKELKRSVPLTARRRDSFRGFVATYGPRIAIAASLVLAIVPIAVQYAHSPSPEDYYTLSDAAPEASPEPRLRVVFLKSLSAAEIDALLIQIQGQRVEGPNSVGAYTVRLDAGKTADELASALAFLRGRHDVMLAEPVLQP